MTGGFFWEMKLGEIHYSSPFKVALTLSPDIMQVEIYVICYAKGQITHNQNGPFDFKIHNGYRLGAGPLKAAQLQGWETDVK